LGVVGGLVIWLHFKIYWLSKAHKQLPALSENLAQSMIAMQDNLNKMKETAGGSFPDMQGKLNEAYAATQDLKYMLDRAEKTLSQMDKQLGIESGTPPKSELQGHVEETKVVVPERKVSPQKGVGAYGASYQTVSEPQTSETEQELRRALEGRL